MPFNDTLSIVCHLDLHKNKLFRKCYKSFNLFLVSLKILETNMNILLLLIYLSFSYFDENV